MSTHLLSDPEPSPKKHIIALTYRDVPRVLGLKSTSKSDTVSNPDEIRFFTEIFRQFHAELSILPQLSVDVQRSELLIHSQLAIETLRPSVDRLFPEHEGRFRRMLFQLSEEMVSREENFFPFLALQVCMLERDLKRNKEILSHILAAQQFEDIDIEWIQKNLRQDIPLYVFAHCNVDLSLTREQPTQPWEPGGMKRVVTRPITLHMPDLLPKFLPQYLDYQTRFKNAEKHVQGLVPEKELSKAVLIKYLHFMSPDDAPETVLMLGEYGEFDGLEGTLIAHIDRSEEELDIAMNAFRLLLASHKLVSYSGILTILLSEPYHYLWLELVLSMPTLRDRMAFPKSAEAQFFQTAFPALYKDGKPQGFIKIALQIVESGKSKKKVERSHRDDLKKYWTPEFSGTLEEQRDQINQHITAILRGEIPEATKIEDLVRKYSLMVGQLEAQIRKRVSGVFYDASGILSSEEALEQRTIPFEGHCIEIVKDGILPKYLDFSLLMDGWPEGVTCTIACKYPGESSASSRFEKIVPPPDGKFDIALDPGKMGKQGNLVYLVTYHAPQGRCFVGGRDEIHTELKMYISPERPSSEVTIPLPSKKEDVSPTKIPETPKERTIQDTLGIWELALEDQREYSISQSEDGIIILTLKSEELVSELHDSSYRLIELLPDDTLQLSGMDPLKAKIVSLVQSFREELHNREQLRERQKQDTIDYQVWREKLQPYWECVRDMSGTEGFTEEEMENLFGGTIRKKFQQRSLPVEVSVDRIKKGDKDSRNEMKLNFKAFGISASYNPVKGSEFLGAEYPSLSDGAKRAFEDLREYIEIIGDFLFLEKSKRVIHLRRMRESRQKLIQTFIEGLKSGRSELVVLHDQLVAPSAVRRTNGSIARLRASFPSAEMNEPRVVNGFRSPVDLRKTYDRIRDGLGGENKHTSVLCLVRRGCLHVEGDKVVRDDMGMFPEEEVDTPSSRGKFFIYESTLMDNIEQLRQSPQGRKLFWERIVNTVRKKGTSFSNGAKVALENFLTQHSLPDDSDVDGKDLFIDALLDIFLVKKIFVSYVRFSAVTIREVEDSLKTTADGSHPITA